MSSLTLITGQPADDLIRAVEGLAAAIAIALTTIVVRRTKAIGRAVNHRAAGEPPLVEKVDRIDRQVRGIVGDVSSLSSTVGYVERRQAAWERRSREMHEANEGHFDDLADRLERVERMLERRRRDEPGSPRRRHDD